MKQSVPVQMPGGGTGRTNGIWISLDGGGTKTQVCVCDENDEIIFDRIFPAINYKSVGTAAAHEAMLSIRQTLAEELHVDAGPPGVQSEESHTDADLSGAHDIRGVVLAAAGCDTDMDEAFYRQSAVKAGFDAKRLLICNDSEAIYRAMTDQAGICLIGGTGSIACAYFPDRPTVRVGGWNPPLSDLGSGYWIGEQILRHYLLWLDGLEDTCHPLYDAFGRMFAKEGEQLQWTVSTLSVPQIASAARLVLDRPEDPLCGEIIAGAQAYLAGYVIRLHRQAGLGSSFPVVLIGGMLGNRNFGEGVKTRIMQALDGCSITFLRPERSPAQDALAYCRKAFPAGA